jgi:hypothetical protein
MKAMFKRMFRPFFRATKKVLRPIAVRMREPLSRLLYPLAFEHVLRDMEVVTANLKGYLEQTDQLILAMFRTMHLPPSTEAMSSGLSAVPLGDNRLLAAHPAAPFVLLDGNDLVATPRIIANRFETHITKVLQQLTKPGFICAELGAGVGYHALTMASASGAGGRVFAIEFEARLAAILRQNAAASDSATVAVCPESKDETSALSWLCDATAQQRLDLARVGPRFLLSGVAADLRRRLFAAADRLLLSDSTLAPELAEMGHRYWTVSPDGTLFCATLDDIVKSPTERHFLAARSLD